MKKQAKEDCCGGCQKGKPGQNTTCQAKLLVEKMQQVKQLEETEE